MGSHTLAGIPVAIGYNRSPPRMVMHGERTKHLDGRVHAGISYPWKQSYVYFRILDAVTTLDNVLGCLWT